MSIVRAFGTVDPSQSVTLNEIRVEPATEAGLASGLGGLVAPASAPEWVWTLRNGEPIAQAPQRTEADPIRFTGDWVWGGVTVHQPGHFVAEHATRLLYSARERPYGRFLFVLRKNVTVAGLSGWFWDVLAWLGIERERVAFVEQTPVIVERLTVFPQAEHLTGRLDDLPEPRQLDVTGMPSQAYLDALAENFAGKRLEPYENDVVYVSRAGMALRVGGERYLEKALSDAGVLVVRPEELSIREQMRVFAGAKHLVFAEGSAMHFRQLIGYVPQKITVLQRRPRRMVARGTLLSRADSLEYVDVTCGIVGGPFIPSTGMPITHAAFPMTDGGKLLNAFTDIGLDMERRWDRSAFRATLLDDLFEWARYVRRLSHVNAVRYALNAALSLHAIGESWELAEEVAREIEPNRGLDQVQDIAPLVAQLTGLEQQLTGLGQQLESLRGSASLRVGRALLSPVIQAKRWYDRSSLKPGR